MLADREKSSVPAPAVGVESSLQPGSWPHAWRWLAVGLLLIGASLFHALGEVPLLGPDEPRYGQVAREMSQRDDFITPTIHGQLWAEKPPLLYWGMVASVRWFGMSEWALRLPSVLAALAAVAALYLLGRRTHGDRYALHSGLVLGTSLGFWGFAHGATPDILLTATMTLGLGALGPGLISGRLLTTGALCGAAVCFALATLAKGAIGIVMPILIVGPYLLWLRPRPRVRVRPLLLALATLVAVASTWYVPVIVRHGRSFLDTFFLRHHFERYWSDSFDHPGPVWYPAAVGLAAALPWTPFLLLALARLAVRRERLTMLAASWCLAPVAFFSLSAAKLPGYVIPAVPGMALLVAGELTRMTDERDFRSFAPCACVSLLLVLLMAVAAPVMLGLPYQPHHLIPAIVPLVAMGGVALGVGARRMRPAILALVFASGATLTIAKGLFMPIASSRVSGAFRAAAIARELHPGELVLGYHFFDHAITFYATARSLYDGGDVVILRSPDALFEALTPVGMALVVTQEEHVQGLEDDVRFRATRVRQWNDVMLLRVRIAEPPAPSAGASWRDPIGSRSLSRGG